MATTKERIAQQRKQAAEKAATGSIAGEKVPEVTQALEEAQKLAPRQGTVSSFRDRETGEIRKTITAPGGTKQDVAQLEDLNAAQRGALIGKQQKVTGTTPLPSQQAVTDILPTATGAVSADDKTLQQFIKSIEELKGIRAGEEEKQATLASRGIGEAGGTSATDLSKLFGTTQLPQQFQGQAAVAGMQQAQSEITANTIFDAKERNRRNKLISSLNQTNIGQIAKSKNQNLAKLTTAQLEDLAASEGVDLSNTIKDRLQSEGKNLIENLKISQKMRLAENDYMKNQLSRTFNRAITDREEFNNQQDAKLRRLAGAFGGGAVQSASANVSIMKEADKGQRILEDLRADFVDRQSLLSTQAVGMIDTYTNNVNTIESRTAQILEDKFAEITNTVDDLIDQGVTNQEELSVAVNLSKIDYMKTYFDITNKAFEAVQAQNQRLFENAVTLKQLQIAENKIKETNRFEGTRGQFFSAPAEDINLDGMKNLGVEEFSDNCVKWARAQMPNLPLGLWTKADKQRAVQQAGFTDPSELSIGDSVLTSEGDVGHVAIVSGFDGQNLILNEANYEKGTVTSGRQLSASSSKIYGFIKATGEAPINVGGNAEKEGTNEGILTQIAGGAGSEFKLPADIVFPKAIQDAVIEFGLTGATGKQDILEDARKAGVLPQFKQALELQQTGGLTLNNEDKLRVERFVKRGGTQEERDNLRENIAPLVAQGLDDAEIARQVFGSELTESQQKVRNTLADDIRAEPQYRDMLDIFTGIQGVLTGLDSKNGFGDVTAINAFQRMVDPGATVREGDITILQSAAPILEKADLDFIIRSFTEGDLLPQGTRNRMQKVAEDLYTRQSNTFNKTVGSRFKRNAKSAGIPFELIGEDFLPISELKKLDTLELAVPEQPKIDPLVALKLIEQEKARRANQQQSEIEIPEGKILIERNGTKGTILPNEFNPQTDIKL
jgi:hypothetical protein